MKGLTIENECLLRIASAAWKYTLANATLGPGPDIFGPMAAHAYLCRKAGWWCANTRAMPM